jgi:hypothetical protein
MEKVLKGDFTYNYITKALADNDTGDDEHSGKVYSRVIDMDWVETIEDAVIYLDKAIREQRRFIEQKEDIVPIEKARKITNESIRHLGQHTNLIARVEADTVTPERILDIQREESFAIYENRFLKTLINNVIRFVEDRYKALKQAPTDSFSKIAMKRHITLNEQIIDFEIKYSCESHERKQFDMDVDVSTLTDFERVRRIRRILVDFMSSQLMRALVKAEPVRPPILRTNLMTKNPNFKKALDLWLFIETYKKPGFDIVGNEYTGKMTEQVQTEVYDVFALHHFLMSVGTNEPWKKQLYEYYLEENARRESEQSGTESERKKYEDFRIAQVREEEMQVRLEEIRVREKQINDLKLNINSQKLQIRQREETIKELKGTLFVTEEDLKKAKDKIFEQEKLINEQEFTLKNQEKLIATQLLAIEEKTKTINQMAEQISTLEREKSDFAIRIESLTEENTKQKATIAENEKAIAALTGELEATRQSLVKAAEEAEMLRETVSRQKAQLNAEKAENTRLTTENKDLKTEVSSLNERLIKDIENLKNLNAAEISRINDAHYRQVSKLSENHEGEKIRMAKQQRVELDRALKKHQGDLLDLRKATDEELIKAKTQYERERTRLEDAFEKEQQSHLKQQEKLKKEQQKAIAQLQKDRENAEKTLLNNAEKVSQLRLKNLRAELKNDYEQELKKQNRKKEQEIARIKKECELKVKAANDALKAETKAQKAAKAQAKKAQAEKRASNGFFRRNKKTKQNNSDTNSNE